MIALERASHLFGRSPNDCGYLIDDVDSPCVSIAVMIHAVGLLSSMKLVLSKLTSPERCLVGSAQLATFPDAAGQKTRFSSIPNKSQHRQRP